MSEWQYFREDEFACKHCGENLIDHGFVTDIDHLRAEYGLPLVVNSGYRCPEYNVQVSTTGSGGPHTTGFAVDLRVDRGNAYRLLYLAMRSGKFTGVGVKQHGDGRFLHLDQLDPKRYPRPNLWSYV